VIKKKRHKSYAKILKKYGHMEVQEEREKNMDTWKSSYIYAKNNDEHMKAHAI
jgi:hypothetical protein